MIIGKVKYYGVSSKSEYSTLLKAYVRTGDKEIHLSIENPTITDSAIEKAKNFYDGYVYPKWLSDYISFNKKPEFINFKTSLEYEPKYVYIRKNNKYVREDINKINMRGAKIAMIYNGPYIGKILLIKNGDYIEECPFENVEDLPFDNIDNNDIPFGDIKDLPFE